MFLAFAEMLFLCWTPGELWQAVGPLCVPHWRASGFTADLSVPLIQTKFSLTFPARYNKILFLLHSASGLGSPAWVKHLLILCENPFTCGVLPGVGMETLCFVSPFFLPVSIELLYYLSCLGSVLPTFLCFPSCLFPCLSATPMQ